MSERLAPSVLQSVVIHTSTFDVGADMLIGIRFWPACTAVGGVSAEVSSRLLGAAVVAERVWILVPVLDKLMSTASSLVGSGSCNISPTPFLKPGNGTLSVYLSVFQAVEPLPSIARLALPGLSASPPGEKTVTRVGFTLTADSGAPGIGELAPIAGALIVPAPTSANSPLSAHASTSKATTRIAPPTLSPMSSPRRRRARSSSPRSPQPRPAAAARKRDGGRGAGSSTGEINSVRSASAVTC